MDDLEREAATLRLKSSDTLAFPRIIGHKRVAGPYRYTVSVLTVNGSWSRLRITYDRSAALAILARFPDGECLIEMHDSLTEDKVAETGRATPQLRRLLMDIRADWVKTFTNSNSGGRLERRYTRQQLIQQYASVYRLIWIPLESGDVVGSVKGSEAAYV